MVRALRRFAVNTYIRSRYPSYRQGYGQGYRGSKLDDWLVAHTIKHTFTTNTGTLRGAGWLPQGEFANKAR